MLNSTQAQPSTEKKNNKGLVVAFQDFNGVFLAKISNLKDRETHAFGATKAKAQQNALRNYRQKYETPYHEM